MEALSQYRAALGKYIQVILTDHGRILERQNVGIIVGDGLVDENILGPLASILSEMERFTQKILIVRTSTDKSHMKCSLKKGRGAVDVELGPLIENISEQTGGSGGGHPAAAGARIPISRADEFLNRVVSKINGDQN